MVQPGRIPNRLRKYRRMYGYSQKELAEKLDMNDTSPISKWEQGLVIPSFDNLLKLAALYHTLIEELYFDHWLKQRKAMLPPCEQVRTINTKNQKL